MINGKLEKGTILEASKEFCCSTSTTRRIWLQAQPTLTRGLPVDISTKLKGRVGRKRVQLDSTEVSQVPLRRRTNIRSMASALNMAKSTLHRRIKEGDIRPHTNAIKPFLTDENKKARLTFCLQKLKQASLYTNPEFDEMFNVVHIDEKWFFQTKVSERYYLLPEETDPIRTCQSKRFITKVMFLAAIARPRFDDDNNTQFDGKIGIFPFVHKEPAQRSSKNRAAGTMETKACNSVTKDVYRSCLLEQVLPAIRNKLICQPPNSPDLNVLDLGFFRSIQALQHQEAPRNIDELLNAVNKAFNELSSECLNNVFLSLQLCMTEVIKSLGSNSYKLPHIGKAHLSRNGRLPLTINCNADAVHQATTFLQTQ